MEQIAPFKPQFTLGERVETLAKQDDGSYLVGTSDGTLVHASVVVIAGGLGCFEPRKPDVEGLSQFEGKGVEYMVKNPDHFRAKKVVLAGGGDSALDWTIFLSNVAERVTLIHRGDTFRGAPDSAEKVFELARDGAIDLILQSNLVDVSGADQLEEVSFMGRDKVKNSIKADYLIPLFGLSPKLGPIANWGLNIDKSAIDVNTFDYSTNIEGIYATTNVRVK